MSVSRPARCLLSPSSVPAVRPRVRFQNFHTSPELCQRRNRRPKIPSVTAEAMGIVTNNRSPEENFKPYTEKDKENLKRKYTPAQLEAIEAGEKAIDPVDLNNQGVIRSDFGTLGYFDDFSQLQPVLDRVPKYEGPVDPHIRIMNDDEYRESYKKAWEEVRAKAPPVELLPDEDTLSLANMKILEPRIDRMRAEDQMSWFMGSKGPVPRSQSQSALAPGLPRDFNEEEKMAEGKSLTKKKNADEDDPRNPDGRYNRLMKQTGMSLNEIWDLKTKPLVRNFVVNQTRLGKIRSIYVLAVAGNQNGLLGIGEAKGEEIADTIQNARISAIRNMQPIPRYEARTIYGEVEGKVAAVKVQLMARPPGFGLRCQSLIYEMARAAGIQDLAARVPRSRNKMNTAKAAYQALMNQRQPDDIARGRGKKLVDVRKVYYGGLV